MRLIGGMKYEDFARDGAGGLGLLGGKWGGRKEGRGKMYILSL